jgi:Putative prokaryotic signal transducing protein
LPDDNDVRLTPVGEFPNRIEAEIAQSALESVGIESMISADDGGGVQPGLWTNGVKLLVREPDAARALEILNP